MQKLSELASVVRSKNAGPLTITLDLLFKEEADFRVARESPSLTADAIARLYGVDPQHVKVVAYNAARAIKIAMPRPIVAGSPGDRDVYGAQQHTQLLEMPL